jgi:hypothetical protein
MVTFFNVFSYYPPICVPAKVAAMTAVAIDGRAAVSKNLDFLWPTSCIFLVVVLYSLPLALAHVNEGRRYPT